MIKITIGKIRMELLLPDTVHVPNNLVKFSSEEPYKKKIIYKFYVKNQLEISKKIASYESKDILILNQEHLEIRMLKTPSQSVPYAIYNEQIDGSNVVYISKSFGLYSKYDTMFFSTLALERHMIQQDSFILHCAYTNYHEKALLFSGPSGSGKSTHSNLWVEHVGAEVINGDRALIEQDQDRFYANGWPICGSSNICLNKRYPIGAVVMMEQGEKNEVRRLSLPEAFRKIMSETTINYWNKEFVTKAMDIITAFVSSVPVYEYRCTVGKSAVLHLKNHLQEELPWMNE